MGLRWNGDEIMRRIEEVAGGRVSLLELLTPAFVQQHTKFMSIDEMFAKSELTRESNTDEDVTVILRSEEWNKFVIENSEFSSWDEMIQVAGAERRKSSLGGT
jgi:hypothetical protein